MKIGLIVICISILVLIFRGKCAKYIISSQNNTWGFRFTEKSVRNTEIQLILFAIVGIIMGVLIVLGIGKRQF
jgi:hypothetical protein